MALALFASVAVVLATGTANDLPRQAPRQHEKPGIKPLASGRAPPAAAVNLAEILLGAAARNVAAETMDVAPEGGTATSEDIVERGPRMLGPGESTSRTECHRRGPTWDAG